VTTARDAMSKDFVMVRAAERGAAARAFLERIPARYVVIRADGPPRWRVMLHTTCRKRLVSDGAGGDRTVGELLAEELTEPTPAVDIDGLDPEYALDQVVLDDGGVVGVLPAARAQRGSVSFGVTAGLECFSADAAPEVTRHLQADLPATLAVGAVATLTVSLSSAAPGGGQGATVAAPLGAGILVIVRPQRGLMLEGDDEGTLVVTDPPPAQPLTFPLKAVTVGEGRVKVQAFYKGAELASLRLAVSIEAEAPSDPPRAETTRGAVTFQERAAPDLSIYVFEAEDKLTFHVESADRRYSMKRVGETRLDGGARDYFTAFFNDIERLPMKTPEERAATNLALGQKGCDLFERAFPEDLRALLWESRERPGTLQVMSDEPWIPWEFCRLQGRVGKRMEEGAFLAEAFQVTRWLSGVTAAPTLPLQNLALVVPDDSGLSEAAAEREHVLSLRGPGRAVTPIPATFVEVCAAMRKGTYDAWHFSGHARADTTQRSDKSTLELQGSEKLTPDNVTGVFTNMLLPRPLVFLNACQSARGGLALTGVGGWAQRFLRPQSLDEGASAFIGTYWSVDDNAALRFAKELYARLLAGESIGLAAKYARAAARADDDTSWLAYTVYADPNARVVPPA